MTPISGDLSRLFIAQSHQQTLQAGIRQASDELVTGRRSDPASAHGALWSTAAESVIQQYRIKAHQAANTEVQSRLSLAVTALQDMLDPMTALVVRTGSADLIVSAQDRADLRAQVESTAERIFARLNQSFAGVHLFAGAETDTPPMASTTEFWAAIDTAVGGAGDAQSIEAALDGLFSSGGTFETTLYRGSAAMDGSLPIGTAGPRNMPFRADDQSVRSALKALAMARIATNAAKTLPSGDRATLLDRATTRLLDAQNGLQGAMTELGRLQGEAAGAADHMEEALKNADATLADLTRADPFDAATRLEDLQNRLHALYAITSRASQITLVNFLR